METFEDVARAVGTPFYAYDADRFCARIGRFRAALEETPHLLCYALKANDALALVAVAADEGLGADIVSGGELAKALRAGVPGGRIVFSGVGKQRDEIRAALAAGVRALNVESLGELDAVAEEAAALGAVAPVSVRLNPAVEADTHAYVATGSAASKFGMGAEEARAAYVRAAADPALEPLGISFHVGSQLLDTAPVLAAAERAAALWRELAAEGVHLRELDVGGGLGIAYDGGEDADVDAYAAALGRIARELGATLVFEPDTHAYVATGSAASKFGLGVEDARAAYARAAADPALEPVGISFHIGSQLLDAAPVLAAAERAAALWRELAAKGVRLRELDVGGGLGIAYDDAEEADVEAYAAALGRIARELGATLVLEPGRWLVGPVGTFVTRVLYVKDAAARRIAVCDGGMNDLIRPALYGARHPIELVGAADGRPRGAVDVVGPVCESGDFFALGIELPLPEPGDLVAIGQAGAYCRVMSSTYNARPLCAEVLREGGAYRVIREPIPAEELAARELA